jgi:hypothetical protein
MPDKLDTKLDSEQPMVYEIRIKGYLDLQWTDWFGGLVITRDGDGNTLLTGTVVDQSALYGLIKKIRDLGVPLLSVNPVKSGQPDLPNRADRKDRPVGEEH